MLSANAINVDKSKIVSSGTELTLSILMTTQEAFVDSVDQDQTVQNVQSDLLSTLSSFSFYIIMKSFLVLAMEA